MKIKTFFTRQTGVIIFAVCLCAALAAAMALSRGGDYFWSVKGIWSILPPLTAITLAFITHDVVISLFVGVLTGTFLLSIDGFNLFSTISNSFLRATEFMLGSATDTWNAGILLQVMAIGGLIGIVTKMGGALAIAQSLAKRAKGPISTQIVTWVMGLIVFFDDYANSLIVGPIMRSVADKNKVSREKLSFIVDATAAPVAGIALISTWIGAEISYIRNGLEAAGITNIAPYNLFVATIPYRFYNIFILAFVPLSALMLREFGPMRTAERRARGGQAATVGYLGEKDKSLEESFLGKPNIWTAIVPLGVLIIGSFVGFYLNGRAAILGGDDADLLFIMERPFSFRAIQECFGASDASIVLFQSALVAGIAALIMGVATKRLNVSQGIIAWVDGLKSLIITAVILILAWSLSGTIGSLETNVFLVSVLSDTLPPFMLPGIVFVLASIVSFATGTSYGTMGILTPLTIPLAHSLLPGDATYLLACTGAVLAGAIFGDHCSPISDTTILSSMGTDCDHMAHVHTQLPYSIAIAITSLIFGYIPIGLGLSVWITLPVGIAAVIVLLRVLGKKVVAVKL